MSFLLTFPSEALMPIQLPPPEDSAIVPLLSTLTTLKLLSILTTPRILSIMTLCSHNGLSTRQLKRSGDHKNTSSTTSNCRGSGFTTTTTYVTTGSCKTTGPSIYADNCTSTRPGSGTWPIKCYLMYPWQPQFLIGGCPVSIRNLRPKTR